MRKKIFPVILLFLLLFLTSCSKNKISEDDSWQEEILFASECGMDGLQCCIDDENPCLYGQECCVDPNNSLLNYCADECVFGKPNTFCRGDGVKCDEGSVCLDDFCQLAGGNKQPCYIDSSCKEGFTCDGELCLECGLPGNPCCEKPNKACLGEAALDDQRASCVNNTCVACGHSLLKLCPEEPFCNDGFIENGDFCLVCGDYNQACCNDKEESCNSSELSCLSGFCLKNN